MAGEIVAGQFAVHLLRLKWLGKLDQNQLARLVDTGLKLVIHLAVVGQLKCNWLTVAGVNFWCCHVDAYAEPGPTAATLNQTHQIIGQMYNFQSLRQNQFTPAQGENIVLLLVPEIGLFEDLPGVLEPQRGNVLLSLENGEGMAQAQINRALRYRAWGNLWCEPQIPLFDAIYDVTLRENHVQ